MFREFDYFERTNGYINIDTYLMEEYNTLNIKELPKGIITDLENTNCQWITINSRRYLFKQCTKEESIKEVLASMMLEQAGFDHAEYDFAYLNGIFGVISKDFTNTNSRYINGTELLSRYADVIDKDIDSNNFDVEKYNNLNNIWDILEVRYYSYPNGEKIVKNIMKNIVEKMAFDCLIDQWDGASYNWMIEETSTNAKFAPIYDNQKMLEGSDLKKINNGNISVDNFEDNEKYDNKVELIKLYNESSDEFKEIINSLIKDLKPEQLKWMLITIESNIRCKLDSKIKSSIISRYEYNYNKLNNALNEERNIKR